MAGNTEQHNADKKYMEPTDADGLPAEGPQPRWLTVAEDAQALAPLRS